MTNLEWTRTPPAKEGWYWWRLVSAVGDHGSPRLVLIVDARDTLSRNTLYQPIHPVLASMVRLERLPGTEPEWCGPVEPPA